jgi:Oxidation resistance protein
MESQIAPRRPRTPQKQKSAPWSRGQGRNNNTPRKHSSAKRNRLLNYLESRKSSSYSAALSPSSGSLLSNHTGERIQEDDENISCSSGHFCATKYDSSRSATYSMSLDPIPDDAAVLAVGKEEASCNCDILSGEEEVVRNERINVGQLLSRNKRETCVLSYCWRIPFAKRSRHLVVEDSRRPSHDDAYIQAAALIDSERQKFHSNNITVTANRRKGMRRLLDFAQGCYGLTLFLPIEHWEDYKPISTAASSPATTISTATATTSTSTEISTAILNNEKSTYHDTRNDETSQEEDDDVNQQDQVVLATDDDDTSTIPPILSQAQMQYIHTHGLPPTVSLMTWTRAYSLQRDGDSFLTMFHKVSHYNNTLIVIKTTKGDVLGGYADTPWGWANSSRTLGHARGRSCSFFGSGRAFLFATRPRTDRKTDKGEAVSIYKWTGENEYSQICDVDAGSIGMGGGGAFGFFVQDNFTRGSSGPCQTFRNPTLVVGSDSGGNFEISDFEVYGFISMSERLMVPGSLSRSSSFASYSSLSGRSTLSTRSMSCVL